MQWTAGGRGDRSAAKGVGSMWLGVTCAVAIGALLGLLGGAGSIRTVPLRAYGLGLAVPAPLLIVASGGAAARVGATASAAVVREARGLPTAPLAPIGWAAIALASALPLVSASHGATRTPVVRRRVVVDRKRGEGVER